MPIKREQLSRSHGARQLIYESETLRSIPVYVHLRLIKSPTNLGFPRFVRGIDLPVRVFRWKTEDPSPLALHPPSLINYSFP